MNRFIKHHLWKGFTVIEILLVVLLSAWVIKAIFDIMFAAQNRFSKDQADILCSREAAFFLAALNRDMERCYAVFPHEQSLIESIREAFSVEESLVTFPIKTGEATKKVQYQFLEKEKEFLRIADGKIQKYCSGKVGTFSAYLKLLLEDGSVVSIPPDPEVAFEPPLPANPRVKRLWIKMRFSLEIPKRPGQSKVFQDYRFLLFPVTANKNLNSIWRWDSEDID